MLFINYTLETKRKYYKIFTSAISKIISLVRLNNF